MAEYYKVIETSSGYWEMHSDGHCESSAKELATRLNGLFPDECYIIESDPDYEERIEKESNRQILYNTRNVVDGWEDIYPDRE
jgi:hypothetical protein